MSLKFCIIIESNSQKTFFAIVPYTKMAAVTSGANQELGKNPHGNSVECLWFKAFNIQLLVLFFGFAFSLKLSMKTLSFSSDLSVIFSIQLAPFRACI